MACATFPAMPVTTPPPLRTATATVVTAAGLAQVAMLWVFDLGAPVLLIVGLLLLLLWWSAVLSGAVTLALAAATTLLAWFVAIYLPPKKVKVWSDDDY